MEYITKHIREKKTKTRLQGQLTAKAHPRLPLPLSCIRLSLKEPSAGHAAQHAWHVVGNCFYLKTGLLGAPASLLWKPFKPLWRKEDEAFPLRPRFSPQMGVQLKVLRPLRVVLSRATLLVGTQDHANAQMLYTSGHGDSIVLPSAAVGPWSGWLVLACLSSVIQ